ncbi:MAG TPA: sulfurtransferase TusA family protein [Syntrophales bacterium]|nr:sulfurtransferase TusA family protein [Syntrophales bacterium]
MAKTIDARGLSCPHPVLMTLEGIKAGNEDELIVLVDSDASRENVSRAAASRGWTLDGISEESGAYRIAIRKG